MKKLMIAVAVAAVAVVANAAKVAWNAQNAYAYTGDAESTTKAGSTYMAFFVNSATLSQSDLAKDYIKDGNIDLSFLSTTSSGSGYSAAFITSKDAPSGMTTGGTLTTTAGNSEPWTGYLVIIDATSIENATHAYVSPELTKTTGVSGQQATLSFTGLNAAGTGSQYAANWYAVPEPTSGLLLLLGVAGLALRRRRT